jgi:ferritin-like metal-binding protein YciE
MSQLKDLYSAENQLVKALLKLAKAAARGAESWVRSISSRPRVTHNVWSKLKCLMKVPREKVQGYGKV